MTRYTFGDLRAALSDPPNIAIVLGVLERGTQENVPYDLLENYVCGRLGYLPISYWEAPNLEGPPTISHHALGVNGDLATPYTKIGPTLKAHTGFTQLQRDLDSALVPLRTEMFEQHWLVWVDTQSPDERARLESLTHYVKESITDPLHRRFVYNTAREHAFDAGWSSASAAINCICAASPLAALKSAVTAILWDDPQRYDLFYENSKSRELAYTIDKHLCLAENKVS